MRKYRIVSGKIKGSTRNFEPWEEYLRRERWRDRYRKQMERKRRVMLFGDAIEMISDLESVSEKAITNVDSENLHKAMLNLSERERYIIRAYYFEQMNDREIGLCIGESQQVVFYRRKQVLCKLRKILNSNKLFL